MEHNLTHQSKNRLSQGQIVSQELKASDDKHRRWIAIYPLVNDRLDGRYEGIKYKIIDFELEMARMDTNFAEEDKKNLKDYLVTSDIELTRLFSENGIAPQKFDSPWKNNYPL